MKDGDSDASYSIGRYEGSVEDEDDLFAVTHIGQCHGFSGEQLFKDTGKRWNYHICEFKGIFKQPKVVNKSRFRQFFSFEELEK